MSDAANERGKMLRKEGKLGEAHRAYLQVIRGATCKVRVSGEDEAMILPAIDEVSQKLGAWLYPRCGGILPIEAVKELKDGKSVACPFCNVTVDR